MDTEMGRLKAILPHFARVDAPDGVAKEKVQKLIEASATIANIKDVLPQGVSIASDSAINSAGAKQGLVRTV